MNTLSKRSSILFRKMSEGVSGTVLRKHGGHKSWMLKKKAHYLYSSIMFLQVIHCTQKKYLAFVYTLQVND